MGWGCCRQFKIEVVHLPLRGVRAAVCGPFRIQWFAKADIADETLCISDAVGWIDGSRRFTRDRQIVRAVISTHGKGVIVGSPGPLIQTDRAATGVGGTK